MSNAPTSIHNHIEHQRRLLHHPALSQPFTTGGDTNNNKYYSLLSFTVINCLYRLVSIKADSQLVRLVVSYTMSEPPPSPLPAVTTTQRQQSSDFYHCHNGHQSTKTDDRRARRVLIGAAIICLLFMMAEVVGGIMVRLFRMN
jgi:hypothetical protein